MPGVEVCNTFFFFTGLNSQNVFNHEARNLTYGLPQAGLDEYILNGKSYPGIC